MGTDTLTPVDTLTAYHAKYFAYELTKRCSSNSVEKLATSLSDAQVDLNPHQVEAALFAFKSPLSKGAILADEVGLGKTIEAGLVIAQKWAEWKRKILIIVPANLRNQWNQELRDKFFLPSCILEAKTFNQAIKQGNLNPFNQTDQVVICSYPFASAKEKEIQQIKWDLVVIDEAHRLRNVYKTGNKIANAIKKATAHSPKILLTATPLQNSLLELYGLVSLIDDYTFGDLKSYKAQFSKLTTDDSFSDLKERISPICTRTLRRQVLEYISYTKRIPITQEFYPTEEEQQLYNRVSAYLESPRLFALPSSQRQLMTLVLRKLLASSTRAITGTLEALATKLAGVIENQNKGSEKTEEAISEDFEGFEALKDEWLEEDKEAEEREGAYKSQEVLEESIDTYTYTPEDLAEIRKELKSLREFEALARSIQKNSKGEVLLTALERGFMEAQKHSAPQKAIIFTESTRTQQYLKDILEETIYKGQIVLFNGSNNDPDAARIYKDWLNTHKGTDKVTGSKTADVRAALVDYFKNTATIMIATEAASEGINLQFCSLVVNYDLPWNPQRIEQRIGRCHRYGQKYDVVVVNFLNKKNAADQRVFDLLDQKFKLFSGVFGASDDILGTVESIESGVAFEKRIAEIYQQHWRSETEIQQAFDALQKKLEPQIDESIRQTRQKLLENFDEEVHEKLRMNKKDSELTKNKYEQWLWQLTRFFLKTDATFTTTEECHEFVLNHNPFSDDSIHPGPYRMGKAVEDANVYRIGHPLAQKIIKHCKSRALNPAELVFDYNGCPKKISIIEPLVGQSGWLRASHLSVQSLEPEDTVVLTALTDQGEPLHDDQARRLFSLPASETVLTRSVSESIEAELQDAYYASETALINDNMARNAAFFDDEMGKLEKWAEDKKNSLEIELRNLDKEIKTLKTESRKILKLENKLKAQTHIKDLEKSRNTMRIRLYDAQDEVDERKENLITDLEVRLKQSAKREDLFLIRWRVV